jgi:hypothetical protein
MGGENRKCGDDFLMRKSKLQSVNAYLTRDKDWMYLKYITENLSIAKMAKLIPCDYRTIRASLIRLEIPLKPKHITYGDIKQPPRHSHYNGMWKGGLPKCINCTNLVSAKGHERCKTCASKYYRGENHHSWKSPELRKGTEAEQVRNSIEYDEWRFAVYKRDGSKCRVCNERKDPMVAHHLDGFNIFPKKRFDVDNGVTLCDRHHIAFHTNYGFGNNTKSQFEEYLATTTEMTF